MDQTIELVGLVKISEERYKVLYVVNEDRTMYDSIIVDSKIVKVQDNTLYLPDYINDMKVVKIGDFFISNSLNEGEYEHIDYHLKVITTHDVDITCDVLIPLTIKSIGVYSFKGYCHKAIFLSNDVKIYHTSFDNCVTLACLHHSSIEKYANKYNVNIEYLD